MSQPRGDQREQEISIKQREGELFRSQGDDLQAGSTKPFSEYLRETPADPLPSWVKAALWAVGVVVALLFAAALWRLQSKPAPRAVGKGRPKHSSTLERPLLFSLPSAAPLPETVANADAGRWTWTNPEKS